jgi:two-component system, NtrC family, response regulator AtoC
MAAPTVRDSAELGAADGVGSGHFLLVLGPDHTAKQQLPPEGTLSIGRGEDADVRIVDALASRAHATLHVGRALEIEDLGSANGTLVRDLRIPAHQRITVSPGDAIAIGTTILVVQRREPAFRPRRLWPHAYFETRLIETCARAEIERACFAVVRIHVDGVAVETIEKMEEILIKTLRPGDVLAAYGPNEYEILLVDTDKESSEALGAQIVAGLAKAAITARAGLAFFPIDGTSPQALVSRACDLVRPGGHREGLAIGGPSIVLENPAMQALYALAEKVARGTINVLIMGETGVGKEILAETVHRLSPRAAGPFVCLNCAALSDTLLESELFGYEKGAFTGALAPKIGLLEAASAGTLFLDEIGEMSLSLQAKVLRAIETKQVMRVGATKPRPVDVRFVAATNRDLEEEIAGKRFREDLYFRLNGVTLTIPPLRERADELPALAKVFLETVAKQLGQPAPRLGPDALAQLRAYAWPGNIRELRNVMERALLLASGGTITAEHLPLERMRRVSPGTAPVTTLVPGPASVAAAKPSTIATPAGGVALSMVEIERQAILDALVRCAGNQTRAAELLGIPRRTFCKKLSEYNIARPRV